MTKPKLFTVIKEHPEEFKGKHLLNDVVAGLIVAIVALPFFFLYGMILFKLSRLFKRFGYSSLLYWLIAIGAIALCAGANYLVWYVLLGM